MLRVEYSFTHLGGAKSQSLTSFHSVVPACTTFALLHQKNNQEMSPTSPYRYEFKERRKEPLNMVLSFLFPATTKSNTGSAGTTDCFGIARRYLDGFQAPVDIVSGNHDLEGLGEFSTDRENLVAFQVNCRRSWKTVHGIVRMAFYPRTNSIYV